MPPFKISLQLPVYCLFFTAYKVCVNTGFGNQLLVLALLYYTPAVDNKDLIGVTDGFQSVRNHNYCFVARQSLNSLLQSILIFGVDICGCLVKNNDRCVFKHSARYGNALLFTARKTGTALADNGVVAVGQAFNKIITAGGFCGGRNLVVRSARATEFNVVLNRIGKQINILENYADLVHKGFKSIILNIKASDFHTAAVRIPKARNQITEGRFAYKNAPESLEIQHASIPFGGVVGIIGHNGAGKSTFSRCFCGLEKRYGTVTVGKSVLPPKERLNKCYMVMQDVGHQLFTESVLDEVLISMSEENADAAKEILDKLDLSALADRHPASLSGGQKQRLAIASAVAAESSVVFLDEPTSGLDYRHMKEAAELLKSLANSGKAVYVITHDPELIFECCTDILHMESGAIAESYPMDACGAEKIRRFFRIE